MGQASKYSGNPVQGNTDAIPSAALWSQVDAERETPGIWNHQWTDFEDLPYTSESIPTTVDPYQGLRVFSSTGGLFTAVDENGGVRKLGSDGDDEGSSVSRGIYPFKIIVDDGELVFEARVKSSTIADTKHGFFLGLIEDVAPTAILPIAAAGTLSDNNLVGFHRLEGDGDKVDTVYKANTVTAVTVQADAATLVADTYIKLGMVFNRGNDNTLRYYSNGVELTTSKLIPSAAGTDFPNDVRLGWIFAVLNATATTPGDASIDWIRVAQRRLGVPGF